MTIVTSAPVSIFSDLLSAHPSRTAYRYLLIDPGVSQRDAVTVDRAKTMSDFKNFMQPVSVAELERLEEAAVRAFLPDFICLDASFLPARIANRLGIPSAIISNFTFDGTV